MSEAPTTWMPLDIGDYLADTMDLSAEQHGAYLLLIMHYWKNASPLKNDKNSLKNVSKISSKNTMELLSRFFTLIDGFWHHKRIDKELANAIEKKKKKANQTASARAAKEEKTDIVTDPVTGLRAETPLPLPNPIVEISAGEKNKIKEIFDWVTLRINSPSRFYIESPIVSWLAWGADFDLDIKPVVERYLNQGNAEPASLAWFDDRIAASIKQRNKPMPEGQKKFSKVEELKPELTPEQRDEQRAERIRWHRDNKIANANIGEHDFRWLENREKLSESTHGKVM